MIWTNFSPSCNIIICQQQLIYQSVTTNSLIYLSKPYPSNILPYMAHILIATGLCSYTYFTKVHTQMCQSYYI